MKVIWAWDNVGNKVSLLGGHKLIFSLLLASASSWHRWYPEDERVLYCDKSTYAVLEERGFLGLWNRVYVVDFTERCKQWNLGSTPAWGFPKLWTASIQKEPFCIVDEDILIRGHFKEGLDLNKLWVYATYNIKNVTGKPDTVFQRDERLKQLSYLKNGAGESYHTAFVYFPDPDFAKTYVNTVFGMQAEMYKLGCFEGRDRNEGGDRDMEFVMGSDEETLYTMTKEKPEIVSNTGLVEHVERKYGLSEEEHWREVERVLGVGFLNKSLLKFSESEVIWS